MTVGYRNDRNSQKNSKLVLIYNHGFKKLGKKKKKKLFFFPPTQKEKRNNFLLFLKKKKNNKLVLIYNHGFQKLAKKQITAFITTSSFTDSFTATSLGYLK